MTPQEDYARHRAPMDIPLPPAGWPEAAAAPRPPMPLPPPPAPAATHVDLPSLDFETYSEAGFIWNEATQKWGPPASAPTTAKKGLPTITLQPYAEHPSTEVLCMAYDLKDGRGRRHWKPGMAPPADLLAHVAAGGLLAAWNSMFEYRIWNHVCTRDFGWPALALEQMRCDAAKSRAYSLPGALAAAGQVLRLAHQKDADGERLLKKFSMPRAPTKGDPRTRTRPEDDIEDAARLYAYNERDIVTEAEASARTPDLDATELQYWMLDQRINDRGVQLDMPSVHNCAAVVRQVLVQYNAELCDLTGGLVSRASEIQRLSNWLGTQGVVVSSLDAESVAEALTRPGLSGPARRALEIRELAGSAAVKKVFAMTYTVSKSGRVHDLFIYHGARTGRTVGQSCQPTNLPKSGPRVLRCASCRSYFGADAKAAGCPWCACPQPPGVKPREWSHEATEHALAALNTGSLQVVEQFFGDAMLTVSGVLRGLFCAAPGHDLICADYSAIEAVVLAMIAGEQWRIDVFRSHAKIYEMSAAKITGIPFEDFMKHAGYTDAELSAPDWFMREPGTPGPHHPMRGKIGKVAELASGFQGWVGAWKAFGADAFLSDEEMRDGILAWRDASPAIVEFWGGQFRGRGYSKRPELFGVEGMFIAALMNPGVAYEFRGFKFHFDQARDVLFLTLLSGRRMAYHRPRTEPNSERGGLSIYYEGWNTNPKNGAPGWIQIYTWGGRLTENIVQAVSRDIQWHGMLALEAAGYPIVLHVYDEDTAEVPEGFGSVEEFQQIMERMPAWAHDWPIRARGGWRGKRFRK